MDVSFYGSLLPVVVAIVGVAGAVRFADWLGR